jgi:hypothetical protein
MRIYLHPIVLVDPAAEDSAINRVDGYSYTTMRAEPHPWTHIHCINRIKKYNSLLRQKCLLRLLSIEFSIFL